MDTNPADTNPADLPQQPIQTFRESLPRANRYYTRVSVEVLFDERIQRIKWFSDLQEAYIWCMNERARFIEDNWGPVVEFPDFADAMDRRFSEVGILGHHCGRTLLQSQWYRYKVYYELENFMDEVD